MNLRSDNLKTLMLKVFGRFSQFCEKRLLNSSCLSVCLSVYMEQFGSHWADFHGIEIWGIVGNLWENASFIKICREECRLLYTKTSVHLWWSPTELFSEWEMFLSCRENQNTHFRFNNSFFFTENHFIFEIILKNMVEPIRPHDSIIRNVCFACCINKTQNKTHS